MVRLQERAGSTNGQALAIDSHYAALLLSVMSAGVLMRPRRITLSSAVQGIRST